MAQRVFLSLLCSTLISPLIVQTASAAPSCDPAIVRRAFHQATALQEENSQLNARTNRALRALFSRGQNAAEDLDKELQRAEAEAERQEVLCMRTGNAQSCMAALRLEQYIESLQETERHLRTSLTRAMNHLVTRSGNISEEITSELDRTTAFVRACLSNGQ